MLTELLARLSNLSTAEISICILFIFFWLLFAVSELIIMGVDSAWAIVVPPIATILFLIPLIIITAVAFIRKDFSFIDSLAVSWLAWLALAITGIISLAIAYIWLKIEDKFF